MEVKKETVKAVLFSIKPKYADDILSGRKTVEVRLRAPAIKPPYKGYIYKTGGGNAVVGEFTVAEVYRHSKGSIPDDLYLLDMCMTGAELAQYTRGGAFVGLRIRDAIAYDVPVPVTAFVESNGETLKRAPISWCYVEERQEG